MQTAPHWRRAHSGHHSPGRCCPWPVVWGKHTELAGHVCEAQSSCSPFLNHPLPFGPDKQVPTDDSCSGWEPREAASLSLVGATATTLAKTQSELCRLVLSTGHSVLLCRKLGPCGYCLRVLGSPSHPTPEEGCRLGRSRLSLLHKALLSFHWGELSVSGHLPPSRTIAKRNSSQPLLSICCEPSIVSLYSHNPRERPLLII